MKALLALLGLLLALTLRAAPPPPEVEAKSYLLLDFESGAVLAGKEADRPLPPASLTKIMTVYIAFDRLKKGELRPEEEVVVSERAWRTGGSRMFLEVGSRVPVEALLKGIIVQSGNDASVALAEHLAGSEELFAAVMNGYAQRLGLENTHFANATGLPDPEEFTTARDMALLTRALIQNFPDFYPLFALKEFTWNGIRQFNRNRLLWQDPAVDGVKTGHTQEAGYNLVASAKRDGRRLICVILGAPRERARFEGCRALLQYGFHFFETERLGEGRLLELPVYRGEKPKVAVGLKKPLWVSYPKGEGRPKLDLKAPPFLIAPLREGEVVGRAVVRLGDTVLKEAPLVVLDGVREGGLLKRWWDGLRLRMRRFLERRGGDEAARLSEREVPAA